MARKTVEDSLKTRDAILEAAEVVFIRKGIRHSTIADIAEEAEMSRGAVYGHFKSKVDVAVAAITRVLADIKELERPTGEGAINYLYRYGLNKLHLMVDSSQVQRILFILYMRSDETPELIQIRHYWEKRHQTRVSELLEEAIANEEVAAETDTKLMTFYFQTIIDGIFCTLFWGNDNPDNLWSIAETIYKKAFLSLVSRTSS